MNELIRNHERASYKYGEMFTCLGCYARMNQKNRNKMSLSVGRAAVILKEQVPRIYCWYYKDCIEFIPCYIDQSINEGRRKLTLTGRVRERVGVSGDLDISRKILTHAAINALNAKLTEEGIRYVQSMTRRLVDAFRNKIRFHVLA